MQCFAEIEGPMWDADEQRERPEFHITGWHVYASTNATADEIVRSTGRCWAADGRVTVTLVMEDGRKVKTIWPYQPAALAMDTISRPVQYEPGLQAITDSQGRLVCDIRGWGWIQYMDTPELRQDSIGRWIASLINAAVEPPKDNTP